MRSLRVRLAILLAVAIVSVVALASLTAVSIIGLPDPDRFADVVAHRIVAAAALAELESDPVSGRPDGERVYPLRAAPVAENDPETGSILRAALVRMGDAHTIAVARSDADAALEISVEVADRGWVVLSFIEPPLPKGGWFVFVGWMVLIVVGAIAISLFLAYVITRPLALLESAVAQVGRDGVLPTLPETGSFEMRATAAALNRLSHRLKTAMDSRMRLVAAAGHDLRTPMTRMRLRAEFLDDDERAKWLSDLDELDRIADSAIGLVREEVEGTGLQRTFLDELVADVVDELAEQGLPVRVRSTMPVVVKASPLALKRALRNLVINAATHGGGALISVAAEAGSAVVAIDDEGPGIPDELLNRVFEPFFRVDPARRQTVPGAGLGLAIANEIIARFHGTITVANRQAGGLRQKVQLPLDEL